MRLPLPVGTVGGGAADHHLRPPPPPPAGPAPAPAPTRRPGPPPAVQQDGGARSPQPPLRRWGRGFCTALPSTKMAAARRPPPFWPRRRRTALTLRGGGRRGRGASRPAPLACLLGAAGRPPPDEYAQSAAAEPSKASPRGAGVGSYPHPGERGAGLGQLRTTRWSRPYRGTSSGVRVTGRSCRRRAERAEPLLAATPPPPASAPLPTRRLYPLRVAPPYGKMAAPSARGKPRGAPNRDERRRQPTAAEPGGELRSHWVGAALAPAAAQGCAGAYVSVGTATAAALGAAAAMDAGGWRGRPLSRAATEGRAAAFPLR